MKKFPHFFSGIQEHVKTVVLYHISSIVVALFVIMGCVAASVLFFFAYNAPVVGQNQQPVPTQSVTVLTSGVDTISRYTVDKQDSASRVPSIPANVFFVPPAK